MTKITKQNDNEHKTETQKQYKRSRDILRTKKNRC
jgi:hypothetical protein